MKNLENIFYRFSLYDDKHIKDKSMYTEAIRELFSYKYDLGRYGRLDLDSLTLIDSKLLDLSEKFAYEVLGGTVKETKDEEVKLMYKTYKELEEVNLTYEIMQNIDTNIESIYNIASLMLF